MSETLPNFRVVSGLELHDTVVEEQIVNAQHEVWIATADLKDMHIRRAGRFKPVLGVFDEMATRGVHFRIVHSALPSRPFRATLETFPRLTAGHLELQICPRAHWKIVVVDGSSPTGVRPTSPAPAWVPGTHIDATWRSAVSATTRR